MSLPLSISGITEKPRITFIIPVYNVCRYLKQCLDSVVSQDYDNLEIIAIDDGSTDDSGSILEHYLSLDHRLHVCHTENRGLSGARNMALDQVHGEYIGFLDGDDWIEPNTIDLLVQNALRYHADIVAACFYKEWVNGSEASRLPSDLTVYDGKTACHALICQKHLGYTVWNKLYRAPLFSDIRFPRGRVYEDVLITCHLLSRANTVVWIPDILFHHRMRCGSIIHSCKLSNAEDHWRAYYGMYLAWKDKDKCFRKNLIQECIREVRRMWFSYSDYPEQKGSSEFIRKIKLYHEIYRFAFSHRREILRGPFPQRIKWLCILALSDNPAYLTILSKTCIVLRFLRKTMYFYKTKAMFESQ